ncbi:MAG: hypothetical protein R2784_10535 [Saprospiraceae bacterium]
MSVSPLGTTADIGAVQITLTVEDAEGNIALVLRMVLNDWRNCFQKLPNRGAPEAGMDTSQLPFKTSGCYII